MSALMLAVFNRDKPHSSITDWVEILSSHTYPDEAYDGIPELAASIHLQSTGPSEVSRALRKKIKHGDSHQKYRALVILKALMENGDHKFQTACMDDHLVDALRHLAADYSADAKVKRKLISILASWSDQFKDDPSLSNIATLYKPSRRSHARSESADTSDTTKKRTKQDARQQTNRAFNFEAEKPKILTAIANATQAASNLVNALMWANSDKENISANARVQTCLQNAKNVRDTIVRYIQLVENEDVIGTLIETNERVVSALQMYDDLSATPHTRDPTREIQTAINGMSIAQCDAPSPHAQDTGDASGHVHPDLRDLSFASLGGEQASLPPPMQPSLGRDGSTEPEWDQHRGSLSDFSDYESEDERKPAATHPAGSSSGGRSKAVVEDPFADPFAD